MNIKKAIKEVEIALMGYIDDCISIDEQEIKNLELAWRTLLVKINK